MDVEGERIRELIAGAGPRGRTTPLPQGVREEVARYGGEQHAAGKTWGEIAASLELTRESVRRCCQRAARGGEGSPALLPVRVRGEAPALRLCVTAPGGFRVEGLSLEQAASLLRLVG